MGCGDLFTELDDNTLAPRIDANPNLTPAQKTRNKEAVRSILEIARDRFKDREEKAKKKEVPPGNEPPLPPDKKRDLEHVSKIMLDIFKSHCPDGSGGINYGCIQDCFEKFANGELRKPSSSIPGDGEPNGAFYFLFAEFAILAIKENVDSLIWSQILKTFVKTQEIFIIVYGVNKKGEIGLDEYSYKNFDKTKQIDEEKKRKLREKYDELDIEKLKERFKDNIRRAKHIGICAIATAAYGSELEPPVQFLRNYRDDILLKSKLRKSFENLLDFYYKFSPPIADKMLSNKPFKYLMKYSVVLPFVSGLLVIVCMTKLVTKLRDSIK